MFLPSYYDDLQLYHPLTSSRHHPPAAAATTNLWLSFGFQRPHPPNFELFWSAAAAAAGLGCLSRRVCAVKPKDVVNVFGRCRLVKTRRRLRVTYDLRRQFSAVPFHLLATALSVGCPHRRCHALQQSQRQRFHGALPWWVPA